MSTIQEYRDLYMKAYLARKDEVDARIASGIEQNRKGDCRLRLTDAAGKPLAGKTVRITQKTHDFKYGANIFLLDEFPDEARNAEYRRVFKEYFNLATVPFYWNGLEPERGKPRYAIGSPKIYRRPAPDLCVDYCKQSGIDAKLHCLCYEKCNPAWLHDLPQEETWALYEKRFAEIAERYAGKLMEFEVINELRWASSWSKTCSSVTYEKGFVDRVFAMADKYFPNDTLVINEGNPMPTAFWFGRLDPYYFIIQNLLSRGFRIDKIGLQNHLFVGTRTTTPEEYDKDARNSGNVSLNDPAVYFKALDVYSDFGLPLEITEVTVPTLGEGEEAEQLQADMLRLWYSVWFSHPLVNTVVYWNTADGTAFVEDQKQWIWNENNVRGGIFHNDMTPKLAGTALYDLFHKEWHTDLTLTTDENGVASFRGFFGDYEAAVDGDAFSFGLHKGESADLTLKGSAAQ